MKVILTDDLPALGGLGEIVEVKDGYARNYLLPRRLAMLCTPDAEKRLEAKKKRRLREEAERVEDLKQLAEQLNGLSINITVKADGDTLYGSVGPKEIVAALKLEHNLTVPETVVVLDEPIKKLGAPDVRICPTPDSEATVKVWIVPEGEETAVKDAGGNSDAADTNGDETAEQDASDMGTAESE